MSGVLLEDVERVARVAGDVALEHFRSRLAVEAKGDGSPVTIADRAAERAAREWIERRFPADGILGEELGTVRPDAPRRWVVDPIDGTRTYIRGVPLWGTLVAVVEGDEVLAGAAYFPALGEMLAAAPGAGCWWNGARCSVSSVSSIADATVLTTDERFTHAPARAAGWRRLAERAALCRSWGDCYGYLLVATGRAEVMADGVLAPWDAAPFLPIIEEAGGVLTDWSGCRTSFGGSAVATNRELARSARELLGVS
ncbi:MAG TPA: histidinol-phosphatase [Gemmatimonadaceae bacterium]|nr:histidinol-phosphatase [Gemmatimonadaceae bacterium]